MNHSLEHWVSSLPLPRGSPDQRAKSTTKYPNTTRAELAALHDCDLVTRAYSPWLLKALRSLTGYKPVLRRGHAFATMQLPAIQFSKNLFPSIPLRARFITEKQKTRPTSAGHIRHFLLWRNCSKLAVFLSGIRSCCPFRTQLFHRSVPKLASDAQTQHPVAIELPSALKLMDSLRRGFYRRPPDHIPSSGGRQLRIIRKTYPYVKPLSQSFFHPIVEMWKGLL